MTRRINYGRLMHKAMQRLLADVLSDVAENGLPGKHHFFITFDTGHPGVDIPAYLRERYKDEMTIVLEEWFEDLSVMGDRFAVTLNFGDLPEKLVIPFDAISTFVDPSVEFGLRFDANESPESPDPEEVDAEDETEPAEEDISNAPKGGDVVSLDRFRKP